MTTAVLDLIAKAKAGSLSREEFKDLWPPVASQDRFLQVVYDDIDEAVTHLPGLWRGGIDLALWQSFWERSILDLDAYLIQSGRAVEELLRCRQSVRPHDIQGRCEAEIARFVSECLGE